MWVELRDRGKRSPLVTLATVFFSLVLVHTARSEKRARLSVSLLLFLSVSRSGRLARALSLLRAGSPFLSSFSRSPFPLVTDCLLSFYTGVLRLPFSAAPALLLSLPGRTQTPSKPRCMWHFYVRRPELMYQRYACLSVDSVVYRCRAYCSMPLYSRSPRTGCLTRSCYKQDRLVGQMEIT